MRSLERLKEIWANHHQYRRKIFTLYKHSLARDIKFHYGLPRDYDPKAEYTEMKNEHLIGIFQVC